MDTVIVKNDGSIQTISIPEEYRFSDTEVYINRVGRIIMLVPKDDPWAEVFRGFEMFTDDFMENGRGESHYEERELL